MKLEDWKQEMNAKLEAFAAYWENENQQNGDQFPMVLGSGDWDEQFKFFLDSGK